MFSWLQCWAFYCARTSNSKCPPVLVGHFQKGCEYFARRKTKTNLLPGVYLLSFKASVFLLCLLFFVYLIFSEFERLVNEKLLSKLGPWDLETLLLWDLETLAPWVFETCRLLGFRPCQMCQEFILSNSKLLYAFDFCRFVKQRTSISTSTGKSFSSFRTWDLPS